jgi:ligand-binding sensor domain-containing protein/nitrogen-specific signal transduction histidine kinase/ActR/RegA family two-component response regulator
MRRIAGWWLAGCLFFAGAVCARVPEIPRFRVVGSAQGLPATDNKALALDHEGYLWIATADGLARFDGIGMRVWRYDPGDPAGLPGNNIQALHVDRRDRVWFAIEGEGIAMLDAPNRELHLYRRAGHPGIGSDDTWAITSRGDDLWFGTYDAGVHRMQADGRIERWAAKEGLPSDTILALAMDAAGTLWVATDRGLGRIAGGRASAVALPGADAPPMVYTLTPEGGAMWVATSAGVWRHEADGRWTRPSWSSMFERPNAMKLIARDGAGYWITSQRGLWRQQGEATPVPVELGGPGIPHSIESLVRQPDGALWVPVYGAGIGYLRSDWRRLAQYTQGNGGLSGSVYRAMAPASDGGVWLGGFNGIIERLAPDGRILRMDQAIDDRLRGSKLTAIVEDHAGRLWVGANRDLLRVGTQTVDAWGSNDARDPVPDGGIDHLRVAPDGSIWLLAIGNAGGVQQRDAGSGRVLLDLRAGESGGLGLIDAEQLDFAADGTPWIADAGGMRYLDRRARRFRIEPSLAGERVYAFAFDGNDQLWLQRLAGLEHYRRAGSGWKRVERIAQAQGMPAIGAAGMRMDVRHRLWISTTRGLYCWDSLRRTLRHYGAQSGLTSEEFIDRGIAIADQGRLLAAATMDGSVVLVDAAMADAPGMIPSLRLDSVSVRRNGEWQPLAQGREPELPWDEHEMRIDARLLAYDDPSSNRYWSRLEGYDRGWIAQGADGSRVVAGLPPGRYALRMRAVDANGNPAREQVLRFRVLPPWWRTPWAYAGSALLALLAVAWAAFAYRGRLQRRHAWQLAEHKRELAEQASDAKSRFLATLGHEVRTPMTGVLGMSELLQASTLDRNQRGQVDAIRRAGEHLLRLVNDALDLARIEAGKLQLDPVDFELRGLVDDVAALMAPLAAQRGLRFAAEVDPSSPRFLRGDRGRISQILLNLIGNAVKFTEHGEVALAVSALAPQGVRFVVRDTGPGLNDEQKARLFRRFEQAEGARTAARYGGSGLGLAISQELAAAMDGRIVVESAPGHGTRFIVELPVPAAESSPRAAEARAARHARETGALRLLLVEDDPTVAEVIAGLLRAQGHVVVPALHGLAALAEVASSRFDLGLLDLDLPGLDGLALARALRARGFAQPLVAVTARADGDAEPAAFAAGFDGFLRKPVTGAMLAEAIAEAVAKRAG